MQRNDDYVLASVTAAVAAAAAAASQGVV